MTAAPTVSLETADLDSRAFLPAVSRGWVIRTVLRRVVIGVSVAVIAVAVLAAFLPGLFTSRDPTAAVPAERLRAPDAGHWFGTDELGRDLFSRVVHGAALSLGATLLAVLVAFLVGSALGLLAGSVGGAVDTVVARVIDVMLSIPSLLLALAVVTALGFGSVNVAIAVGFTGIGNFARVMRAEVLKVIEMDYVECASAAGVRRLTIVLRHVLPNASGSVVVLATLEFGTAILSISSLSFLGFGAAPPAAEWGSLVADGRSYLATAWWLTTIPGLVIVAVVLSFNRISHAIDERFGVR